VTLSRAEKRRLAAVRRLDLLDTPPEETFDRLTRLAKRFYRVPIALFTLIDENRQWFKSNQGLDFNETPRSMAFCGHTVNQESIFIVEDASLDTRFRDNPLVTGEPHIRFYAGVPVRDASGFKVGTLCIIDYVPHKVSELDLDVLRSLASLIEDEVERAFLNSHEQEYVSASQLTRAIHRAQNTFLTYDDESAAFELMLNDLLTLTDSQFGFVGEVLHYPDDRPYLKIAAITNIAWSPETEGLYQQVQRRGMIFDNLDNLIGSSLVSEDLVTANDFDTDPRRGGLPEGHPSISTYQGIPIYSRDRLIGLVGLANRIGGYCQELADELRPLLQTVGQLIERKRLYREKLDYKKSLEWAANYDALTRLPNRRRLTAFLEEELVEADKRGGRLSVCFVDLDGFKDINDEHGHAVGDTILKVVAERLKECVREYDMVARLGGDEFVAVLREAEDHSVYQRILDAVRLPVAYLHHELQVSGSMGVTLYPSDNSDPDLLLRHADQAMYAAKESGKNQYRVYDIETHFSRKERLKVLDQIPQAIAEKQFEMYLQPKINLVQRSVEGFEALIRWNHPEFGLQSPASFLPHLEYTEYAATIGRFVMEDAVDKLKAWQTQGLRYSLSINLSPSHFLGQSFEEDLGAALESCEEALRSQLVLELLETTALDDADTVIDRLSACRTLGVDISLDDFGTGYSSLDYFRRLPAQEIKIDRSFVTNMLDNTDNELIVGAIIGLCKNFRRRVVAEGIEDDATQKRLAEMGCYLAQGFYFTKPLPAQAALEWAEAFNKQGF